MRLNRRQRISARDNFLEGAHLVLRHPASIHYTQKAARWQGLSHHLRVVKGQYPNYADCSSMQSWLLWNALTHALKDLTITDIVNGQHWLAGYTGSMVQHGKHLSRPSQPGDQVFYGNSCRWPYGHVAGYIGGGYVVSHGSESGPYKLRWDYRHPCAVRRYILAPWE